MLHRVIRVILPYAPSSFLLLVAMHLLLLAMPLLLVESILSYNFVGKLFEVKAHHMAAGATEVV